MNTLELTKQLVNIPSFVGQGCDERAIGEFIVQFLQQNSNLEIIKQDVENGRFNILAFPKSCYQGEQIQLDMLFIDHMDTVEPKQGWSFDQFQGMEKDGRFYGLGVGDTKGNLAAMLQTALKVKNQKVGFLFYIDEEYDFKGMIKFVEEFSDELQVKEIISLDGDDLQILDGCRGLIELELEVRGKTGHSANPANGVNAITTAIDIYNRLNWQFSQLRDGNLGVPTLNIAYLEGGLDLGDGKLGRQGNNIADFAQLVLECRTNTLVNASKLITLLQKIAAEKKVQLTVKNVRHDLSAWQTKRSNTVKLINVLKSNGFAADYVDIATTGYVDVAMLNKVFAADCYCTGAITGNAHAVDEWVDIQSLSALENILEQLIKLY